MSEEQARQLLQQLQLLEAYIAELSQKEATLVSALREAASAVESIKAIKEEPDSETLVPVGLGAYLQGKIPSNGKILVNIGADVAVEKDADSAINYLEARIKEIQVILQDVFAKKQDAAARLDQGREQMNQLARASAQRQGPGNV